MSKKPDPHLPIGDTHGASVLKRLYAMTEDEAIKQTLSFRKKDHLPQERFPIDRWTAAQGLIKWHDQYKHGNKSAIPEALYLCALNDLPIPRWLACAYLEAFRDVVLRYRAKSWDQVFGKPHKKGTHLGAKRQFREESLAVYQRVKEILRTESDTPIDGYLFERVGKEFGVGGKTLAEGYYYHWKERLTIPTKT